MAEGVAGGVGAAGVAAGTTDGRGGGGVASGSSARLMPMTPPSVNARSDVRTIRPADSSAPESMSRNVLNGAPVSSRRTSTRPPAGCATTTRTPGRTPATGSNQTTTLARVSCASTSAVWSCSANTGLRAAFVSTRVSGRSLTCPRTRRTSDSSSSSGPDQRSATISSPCAVRGLATSWARTSGRTATSLRSTDLGSVTTALAPGDPTRCCWPCSMTCATTSPTPTPFPSRCPSRSRSRSRSACKRRREDR